MNTNKIKFIIVVSIALLATDLIYHQVVNGSEICDEKFAICDQRYPHINSTLANDTSNLTSYEIQEQNKHLRELQNNLKDALGID
jgi:hypothetical protein